MRMAIWGEFFLEKILQKGVQGPTKVQFVLYKQVRGRNGDHEWPMLSYYVIYYEQFRKIMQQTEKEALINLYLSRGCWCCIWLKSCFSKTKWKNCACYQEQ